MKRLILLLTLVSSAAFAQAPGTNWEHPAFTVADSGIQVVLILPDGGPLAVNQGAAGSAPWLVLLAPDGGPAAVTVPAGLPVQGYTAGAPLSVQGAPDGGLPVGVQGSVTATQGPAGSTPWLVLQAPDGGPQAVTGTVTATLVGDGGNVRFSISDAPAVTGTVSCNLLADGGNTSVAALQAGTWSNTVTQGTGTNLHAVLDTTSTTACTQATGTNLHAVLDTTSTTAVTQATGTNLHAVLDTTSTTAATQASATNLQSATQPNNAAPLGTVWTATVTGGAQAQIYQATSARTPQIDHIDCTGIAGTGLWCGIVFGCDGGTTTGPSLQQSASLTFAPNPWPGVSGGNVCLTCDGGPTCNMIGHLP